MSMELLQARFGVNPKAFAFPHTDSGVDEKFFTEVFSEPLLDVSFGTGRSSSALSPAKHRAREHGEDVGACRPDSGAAICPCDVLQTALARTMRMRPHCGPYAL